MKSNYFIIFLLFVFNFGYSADLAKPFAASATITGGTTVCQNATNVLVTFTGSGGTAPYTFVYTINGGSNQNVASGSNNFASVTVTTSAVTEFSYKLISVQDASGTEVLTLDPVIVKVIAPFTVSAGSNMVVCRGNPINLTSSVSGNGSNAVTYSWTGPNGYVSNQQSPTLASSTILMSGNYTVTAKVGNCQVNDDVVITILEPKLAGAQLQDYNGSEWLVKCTEPGTPTGKIFVSNGVPNNLQSYVSSYSINWGVPGVPNFTSTSGAWSTNNIYNIGLYTLTLTINTTNGCVISKSYTVFVGNQPASPQIQLPANAQGCTPFTLVFPISGVSENVPGTTYKITFSDDLANPLTFTQFNIPTSITKTFTTTSCGSSFTNGSTIENNGFGVSIQAVNPCGSASSSSGPIRTSSTPTAIFTLPVVGCVNQIITTNNQSVPGSSVTASSCNPNGGRYWQITPSTGWNLNSGTLGDNGGSPDEYEGWTNGSVNLSIKFNIAGNYSVKLFERNSCSQTSVDTQTICIEPPLTPLFALNTNSGCTPLAITTTNTTNLVAQCSPPIYEWSVGYAAGNCGTTSGYSYTNNTSATSANPSFNFTEAGTYTLTLKTTNSCGSTTTSQTIVVKKPPTVSINPIATFCGPGSITPSATINSCAPASSTLTYAWSFPGGTPATAATANPGSITYSTPGSKSITLIVTNECGPSNTATQIFTVNPTPTITNTDLSQTICSGTATAPIVLTSTPAGATYTWTAAATPGVSGFTASGTASTIPAQILTTTNTSSGTVTYTITPKIGDCTGTAITYVSTVNPAPTITTQPAPSTICLNGTATGLTVAINSNFGVPTYQWYSNSINLTTGGTAISGATSATFNPPTNVVGELYYYCKITFPSGGCVGLTSATALVKVVALPIITTQPLAFQNICVGIVIANPLSVTASGGLGIASYQWFSNSTNATTGGTAIGSATGSTYMPPIFTTAGTYYYYVIVTFPGNNCGSITSQSVVINVFADPTITSQPIASQTLCSNAAPTNLVIVADGGNGSFNYQWYSNTTNSTSGGTLLTGATSASYTPPTTTVGTKYYYCIITQSTLGCNVTSAISTVIINQSPTASIPAGPITSCIGGSTGTLTVTTANGVGTPTYQWYSNSANQNTLGTAIVGQTSSTFSPPSDTAGTTFYYCLVTFDAITGSCSTVATNTSKVEIIPAANVSILPITPVNLCVGVTISSPLAVSYTGGTGNPTYQWFSNTTNSNTGGTLISGANTASYTPPTFNTAGTFYFYAEVSLSGSGCGAVNSAAVAITVSDDPTITSQPIALQTLCSNAIPTDLVVTATGGNGSFNYQWYSNTTNSTNGGTLL
ncbi:PKD domain-containing protein, partial [Flavobacterium tegetincola]|uniref:PKD domain-containing protein n=1 Tax=Flavobacterium tegetincola TaxID=150172 RepID=UPI00047E0B7D